MDSDSDTNDPETQEGKGRDDYDWKIIWSINQVRREETDQGRSVDGRVLETEV